jgi:hypothetical protein
MWKVYERTYAGRPRRVYRKPWVNRQSDLVKKINDAVKAKGGTPEHPVTAAHKECISKIKEKTGREVKVCPSSLLKPILSRKMKAVVSAVPGVKAT